MTDAVSGQDSNQSTPRRRADSLRFKPQSRDYEATNLSTGLTSPVSTEEGDISFPLHANSTQKLVLQILNLFQYISDILKNYTQF